MFSLMGLNYMYLYIIFRLMEFFLSISYWVDLLSYHILNFILFFIYNFSKRYMYIPFLHFERVCRISDFIFGANGVALLCVHIEHECCLSIILLIPVLPVYQPQSISIEALSFISVSTKNSIFWRACMALPYQEL